MFATYLFSGLWLGIMLLVLPRVLAHAKALPPLRDPLAPKSKPPCPLL